MSKKFIIALDLPSARMQDATTLHFRDQGWGFWHWLKDLWFLADVPDEMTPRILWDDLIEVLEFRGLCGVILGIDSDLMYWGGLNQDAWPWMAEKWAVDHLTDGVKTGRKDVPVPFIRVSPVQGPVSYINIDDIRSIAAGDPEDNDAGPSFVITFRNGQEITCRGAAEEVRQKIAAAEK